MFHRRNIEVTHHNRVQSLMPRISLRPAFHLVQKIQLVIKFLVDGTVRLVTTSRHIKIMQHKRHGLPEHCGNVAAIIFATEGSGM